MRKRTSKIHADNYLRALVTDTVPFETPLIFSNDGLYLNSLKFEQSCINELYSYLILNNKKPTLPFNYMIRRNNESLRKLSLVHPSSQHRMALFYKNFSDVICYFTNQSHQTIRAPKKVSSTYYKENSNFDFNKFKKNTVESLKTDFSDKHNISYYSYRGYDRIYKFYNSSEFLRLEKRYSTLWMLDISKCFDSIYTHSIAWATKEKIHVKENVSIKSTFGQQFDMLMQQANDNQTNGIVIGPEISRIFAEIIFQRIDLNVESKIYKKYGYKSSIDYKIRRYVDDSFIFANNDSVASVVFDTYSDELRKYNLHVNESKREKFHHPFLTKKSIVINEVNDEINKLTSTLYQKLYKSDSKKLVFSKINRPDKLYLNFVSKIKSICSKNNSGYDEVSSYIISSLDSRIQKIIRLTPEAISDKESQVNCKNVFGVFIDVMFYFYTVSPSISASYKLCQGSILSYRFFEEYNDVFLDSVKDKIFRNIIDVVENNNTCVDSLREHLINLEVINIVLLTADMGNNYLLPPSVIEKVFDIKNADLTYHEIISCLFYFKKHKGFSHLKSDIFKVVDKLFSNIYKIEKSSELAHLFLDCLSCPYIERKEKKKWLRSFYKLKTQQSFDDVTLNNQIDYMENNYWFVNWKEINLLNLLEKKELKTAY
ncbi:antiviral reverse transcriptase Drt3b [Photobacterium alginatilyticum]|uniref:RNA-directed DNA polymerase n=1 Tax=Photobacterium alginatilyticum TaxID=1775171 RepID=A0ABW9YM72_9GAMM|nr:antiviral reverse transcriptase Drt3b [Photobacterium alginatilyticum]NBI54632.1 RNA-directed DNA polymerase [Photobacterium alginatilyticum]